ncbi:hypothetical protein HHK36_030188 [Tetracentron sinense]|uniref:Uncharacterized protein n=1 Tax=Tetracentron sinense TaxID=13715 RepID=A0A834YD15_TETSI|nr:hypothetical protein HHK36_030188 [Tetracentron sinense]
MRSHFKCTAFSGSNRRELRLNDEFRPEPFWLSSIKEAIWALRSLFVFLVEQPGQLRFIEWPSFQSTDKKETQVPVRDDIREIGCSGDASVGRHGVESDVEFKPIEHPAEPPDEDWPLKCPMPDFSVLNDGRMREECFAESLQKRVELSSGLSEEGIVAVATKRPARAVRKRHHTLTRDHTVPPVFRLPPLPPLPIHSTANFLVLPQNNEFES